ncbi:MAG: adenylate/guanylate cyclase domain-containing protein [gamma proteobacterium endosymbiont of Lamellibrachia anaximandri]|nr:adenylate/guanylate cyclase domain-containing protein [gamma proteobacterium endosymbiont of Lamellibrachia anaximandri]MBL3534357.1 adenylate/guanylate cyclase domain-containing protein [gamma proteobacterium endosymbiont of Lamellibrachia anaximandri]
MTPPHAHLDQLVAVIRRIGTEAADSEDARLQKTLLIGASLMLIMAGLLWGGIYIAFDEPLAGAVPISYAVVSALSIVLFGLTHRYQLFRFSQLLLILILPFLLHLALGGFVNSSGAILWSLICPFGALLIGQRHHAPRWFLAFLGLVIISGMIQPDAHPTNNLPPWLVIIFFIANIGTVSAVAFILLHYFIGQESRFLELLRLEQEKSENLLKNVLPKEIAAILKDNNETIAEHYDSVSILFADIVGFTTLSNEMSPTGMVDLLNEVFSRFDSLVSKYNLEKIRTIGDNYMVVSGAPRPRPDHALALARLALEMRTYIEEYRHNGRRLSFRIGISSGPVIGGVIGRQKFHYDVWGDAVNMASRMESHGVPGKIQITQETYKLLKDACICLPRGKVSVKGKGEMETWFLEGFKADHEAGHE